MRSDRFLAGVNFNLRSVRIGQTPSIFFYLLHTGRIFRLIANMQRAGLVHCALNVYEAIHGHKQAVKNERKGGHFEKKKMETKGSLRRPRGHIPGPRAVSRIATSILAGCMILMIMTASLPLTWSIPEAGVYAAETEASTAASDPASDAAPGQMTLGGEYDNAPTKRPKICLCKEQTDRRMTGTTLTRSQTLAVRILAVMTVKRIRAAQGTVPWQRQIRRAADPQETEEKGGSPGKGSGETKDGGESEAVHRKLLRSKRCRSRRRCSAGCRRYAEEC